MQVYGCSKVSCRLICDRATSDAIKAPAIAARETETIVMARISIIVTSTITKGGQDT